MTERTYPPMPEAARPGDERSPYPSARRSYYNADQMRAFADAARAMALEEAAQIAEDMDYGTAIAPAIRLLKQVGGE